MAEVTECMKELGITQEVLRQWQEEEDPGDEPGPFLMPSDIQTLEQRRAEGAAKQLAQGGTNSARNGHGERTNAQEEAAVRRR